jgi:hypothetical protein
MIYLNKNEIKKFDYLYNNQDYVGDNFFTNSKRFDKNANLSTKCDYFVDYAEKIYGILSPNSLKHMLENCK